MLLRGWRSRCCCLASRLAGLPRQRATRQTCTAQAPPSQPTPGDQSPPLPHTATPRGAWQRGSRRQRLPPAAMLQLAEQQRALSAASYDASESEDDASPPAAPSSPYQAALQASLSRTTLTMEQLLALAGGPPHQQQGRQQQNAAAGDGAALVPPEHTPALASALAALHGNTLDALLESWEAVAHERPPGCDRQQHLELPGLADAAAVSRVGRLGGQWKASNQDTLLLQALEVDAGAGPSAFLLGVLDGHGLNGEQASATAAAGIAASVHRQLAEARAAPGGSGSGGGSSGGAALQQALVAAFQTVAASMAADAAFVEGGAAAVVCAVAPGSLSVAWAGDCRAVVGLALQTAQGPTLLVHPCTTDHRPDSPLEMQRIAASGAGRVLQLRLGGPPRLCGLGQPNTLALSRAFGDTWALQLGLTAEADAVTIPLPPPVALPLPAQRSLRPRGIVSLSDGDDEQAEAEAAGGSGSGGSCEAGLARHVLVCGSDGLWDMLENEEAVSIALSCATAEEASYALVYTAQRRWAAAYGGGSMDDCTAAVAFLTAP